MIDCSMDRAFNHGNGIPRSNVSRPFSGNQAHPLVKCDGLQMRDCSRYYPGVTVVSFPFVVRLLWRDELKMLGYCLPVYVDRVHHMPLAAQRHRRISRAPLHYFELEGAHTIQNLMDVGESTGARD